MDSYKLVSMAQVIYEDEGIKPLTFSQIINEDGATVFVIGDRCGYGVVNLEKMSIVMDQENIDIYGCGNLFFAYGLRPYNLE